MRDISSVRRFPDCNFMPASDTSLALYTRANLPVMFKWRNKNGRISASAFCNVSS